MKKPQLKGSKVIIGPCRLSYCHVFEKHSFEGGEAKYMTNILIPKDETETVDAIKQAIAAAEADGTARKWGGQKPKKMDSPLRDGDEKDDAVYQNHWYINAKSGSRPCVVDKKGALIDDPEEMYSGVWAYASVSFYPFAVSGNKGVACGLNNLMKFKDDEHLGGGASAQSDFSNFIEEADDDDDM